MSSVFDRGINHQEAWCVFFWYMYAWMHGVRAHVCAGRRQICVHACRNQRTSLGGRIFSLLSQSVIGLELTRECRLAGYWAQESPASASYTLWLLGHVPTAGLLFSNVGSGYWTQVLVLARQALYQLNHVPRPGKRFYISNWSGGIIRRSS